MKAVMSLIIMLLCCCVDASPYTVMTGSLREFIENYPTPGADGPDRYQPPTPEDIENFRHLINHLLEGAYHELPDAAAAVGYETVLYIDTDREASHIIFIELGDGPRTWRGVYVFPLNPGKALIFEAPHPIFDKGTKMQAVDLYLHTQAHGLMIAGTHRHNLPGESDMAHAPQSFFQAAHEQLQLHLPHVVAVSLHGMTGDGKHDICISNGTAIPRDDDALPNRLAAALRRHGGACRVSSHQEAESTAILPGTTNVQGIFSNGVAEDETEHFLHFEQSPAVRADPDSYRFVIDAFMENFDLESKVR